MTQSFIFVENCIDSLFTLFPGLKECFYYFDESTSTHFIKINSDLVYKSDKFSEFYAEKCMFYYDNFEGTLSFLDKDMDFSFAKFIRCINMNISPIVVNGCNVDKFDSNYDVNSELNKYVLAA